MGKVEQMITFLFNTFKKQNGLKNRNCKLLIIALKALIELFSQLKNDQTSLNLAFNLMDDLDFIQQIEKLQVHHNHFIYLLARQFLEDTFQDLDQVTYVDDLSELM